MKITWYTTAAIRLESDGESLLFDPFVPKSQPELLDAYAKERFILITHGHLDHLRSSPDILRKSNAVVYCTQTPRKSLLRQGVDASRITQIAPGDKLNVGGCDVKVLRGRHIKFDAMLVATTFIRSLTKLGDALEISRLNREFPENGETIAFQVSTTDKTILVLGSLGLDDDTGYGTPDVLVLPYQGRSDIEDVAMTVVARAKPKTVFLNHFDNAFPPISRTIDTSGLIRRMEREFPQMMTITPETGKEYAL